MSRRMLLAASRNFSSSPMSPMTAAAAASSFVSSSRRRVALMMLPSKMSVRAHTSTNCSPCRSTTKHLVKTHFDVEHYPWIEKLVRENSILFGSGEARRMLPSKISVSAHTFTKCSLCRHPHQMLTIHGYSIVTDRQTRSQVAVGHTHCMGTAESQRVF